jgi:hypothetical protein
MAPSNVESVTSGAGPAGNRFSSRSIKACASIWTSQAAAMSSSAAAADRRMAGNMTE